MDTGVIYREKMLTATTGKVPEMKVRTTKTKALKNRDVVDYDEENHEAHDSPACKKIHRRTSHSETFHHFYGGISWDLETLELVSQFDIF